jgi:hypothetical protein
MINNWLLTGADVVPDQFTLTDITNASLNTTYITTLTPVGYDGFAAWSIDSGLANTTGNTTLGTSGLIGSGQSLFIRKTSSSNYNTTVDTVLSINGISDTWSITTRAADTVPNPFTFTNVTSAERSNTYSSSVILTDYDFASWNVTAVGGEAQGSNTGTTWSTSGTIFSGETFYIRANSGSAFGNTVIATANVGGISNTFTVTCRDADISPVSNSDIFIGAAIFTEYTSNTLTITGLEANFPVNVSVSGSTTASSPSFSVGTSSISGTYLSSNTTVTTSGSGTFVISVKGTTGSSLNTNYYTYLNVGSTNNAVTFNILTRQADETPSQFNFTDINDAVLSTQYTTSTVVVSGLEPNYPITISASGGTIDAGTSSLSGTFASSKTVNTSASGTLVMAARVTSSSFYLTTVNCTVTIGGVSDIYSVTTGAVGEDVYTAPGTYSWTAPANVTSVCVVCVGGGGGGGRNHPSGGMYRGGGGGGLGYVNNVSVTPGLSYTVVVGSGGTGLSSGVNGSSGGESRFATTCYGYGGGGGTGCVGTGCTASASSGGSYSGSGGGTGGNSPQPAGSTTTWPRTGGGGAGGYSGNGGGGGDSGSERPGTAGSGGAGGGAGGGGNVTGGGGGVGLYGQGANGAGGIDNAGGGGGSGGSSGGTGGNLGSTPGGSYGGGGGATTNGDGLQVGSSGAGGAVRIIWGPGRSFPNNAT